VAKPVDKITLGVDIAKDECVVYRWDTEQTLIISNRPKAIKAFLGTLYGPVQIALESTSDYHRSMMELAMARGHAVYLINPRQLVHYREAVNERNKTDTRDAWLLARYLVHEESQLRPCQPQSSLAHELWGLIKRRAMLVSSSKQLQQSFKGCSVSCQGMITSLKSLLARIERQIMRLIRQLGWQDDYQRCLSIPGVGPLNAAALTAAYHRGEFRTSDAFIAFLGMDVRIRESGKYAGKRKLTKRGESELRRLLYCAAQPARCYPPFETYLQRQLDKGLSKTAAKVILARKLARIAFALMRQQNMFQKQTI
jgi:transposase